MKKISKLVLVLLISIFLSMGAVDVHAASNPYPEWQTIGGVTTRRCTWYAWKLAYERTGVALPGFGNGGQWYDNARRAGYQVGSTARANSLAVWQDSGYGHVGFVESVSNGKMHVLEGGRTDLASSTGGIGSINLSSAVGTYRSGGTQKLIGFVYLTSGGSSYSIDNVSATPSANSCFLVFKIHNNGANVTRVGCKIFNSSGGQIKDYGENCSYTTSFVNFTLDLAKEAGLSLAANTTYYYQPYAVIGGGTHTGTKASFKTVGYSVTLNNPTVTETNAILSCRFINQRTTVPTVGCKIWDANGNLLKTHSEGCGLSTNYVDFTLNLNTEAKLTLTKGTTYYYQMYAVIGSSTVYCDKSSFKTSGTKNLSEGTINLSNTQYIYDGTAKSPAVTVKYGGTDLIENKDYTLSYKNNVNPGSGTVTIAGKGDYKGSVNKAFAIVAAPIDDFYFQLEKDSFLYDGTEKRPKVSVEFLQEGTDYIVGYRDNINVGTASVIITGMDHYTGTVTLPFTIIQNSGGNGNGGDHGGNTGSDTGNPGDSQTPGSGTGNLGDSQTPGSGTGNPGNGQTPGSGTGNPGNGQTPGSGTQTPGNGQTPGSSAGTPGNNQAPGNNTGNQPGNNPTPNEPINETVKKGEVKDDANGFSYIVTNPAAGKVQFRAVPNLYITSMTIPSRVVLDGRSYIVESIAPNAFLGCTSLKAVKGCSAVTQIGSQAFAGCKKLTQVGNKANAITLTKVKSIGTAAFQGCTSIRKVNITSKNLTAIGKNAFVNCTKLNSFSESSLNLKTIGSGCFLKDKSLKTIVLKTTKLASCGKNAFKGIHARAQIKVPRSKLKAYQKKLKNKGQGKKVTIKK